MCKLSRLRRAASPTPRRMSSLVGVSTSLTHIRPQRGNVITQHGRKQVGKLPRIRSKKAQLDVRVREILGRIEFATACGVDVTLSAECLHDPDDACLSPQG